MTRKQWENMILTLLHKSEVVAAGWTGSIICLPKSIFIHLGWEDGLYLEHCLGVFIYNLERVTKQYTFSALVIGKNCPGQFCGWNFCGFLQLLAKISFHIFYLPTLFSPTNEPNHKIFSHKIGATPQKRKGAS